MTEAELYALSQYRCSPCTINKGLVPLIEKVLKRQRTPEDSLAAAKRIVAGVKPDRPEPFEDFIRESVQDVAKAQDELRSQEQQGGKR
jgi:hypothetical protein